MKAATQIKECPACRKQNTAEEFFCKYCGAEIATVQPRDAGSKAASSSQGITPLKAGGDGKRQCPKCGRGVDSFLPMCSCGHEFPSTPFPGSSGKDEPGKPAVVPGAQGTDQRVELVIGSKSYACRDGDILGREGTIACEVFAGIGTVSRKHLLVSKQGSQWFATSLSDKNKTQLDGKDMPSGIAQPLSGEHLLRMSTKCEVKLRVL